MTRKPWTAEQIELLKRLYPDMPTRDVARRCGHPLCSTYGYAQSLGLQKSEAFRNSPASGRLKFRPECGERTRFPKGHVPANKGLRRPGWHRGRMRETQFKRGNAPHTLLPIGAEIERKDGYIWIKVSENVKPARRNWKSKHRAIWEAAHGPVPPGYVVVFKNRDKRDFAEHNLELISFAESLRRNSIYRYPKELVDVIRLRGALQRQINKRSPKPKRGRPPKNRNTETVA